MSPAYRPLHSRKPMALMVIRSAPCRHLGVGMDLGWVGNLSSADVPAVQLQVITSDASAPCNPTISVGVAAPVEVDAVHERVVATGLEIVHPLTDEDWGVRRFFFRDHDGNVINAVANS